MQADRRPRLDGSRTKSAPLRHRVERTSQNGRPRLWIRRERSQGTGARRSRARRRFAADRAGRWDGGGGHGVGDVAPAEGRRCAGGSGRSDGAIDCSMRVVFTRTLAGGSSARRGSVGSPSGRRLSPGCASRQDQGTPFVRAAPTWPRPGLERRTDVPLDLPEPDTIGKSPTAISPRHAGDRRIADEDAAPAAPPGHSVAKWLRSRQSVLSVEET